MTGCEADLDDAVLRSSVWSEHLDQMRELFRHLSAANLTINLAKCEFSKATVTYLGKVVGRGHVWPVEAKVEAICNFPVPTSCQDLHWFLGMVRYYRGFCQTFAIIVITLIDLLSSKSPFIWTNVAQQAFEAAKALLATAPVLAAPRFEDPFCLAVDASDFGMGSVLLQVGSNGMEAFAPLSCQCNTF